MSVNVGTAIGYLDLDTSKFDSAFEQANDQLKKFGDKSAPVKDRLEALGSGLTSVGSSMTKNVTTPILGLGAGIVTVGANFDSAMSKVSAISGATGSDLLALRDKAKEMGASTKFSATESAEAFTYMAMAGWDTEDMLNSISGLMSLAAADGLDLASTSDIVTDAMTAFGLSAKGTTTVLRDGFEVEVSNASHFADVLAQAGRSANTNVSLLGESFKYVAPLAGTLGYSVEDTSIALGLMANAGIKGSQAGTSLRTALANLAKPSDAMAQKMTEYGVSLTNADGSMKSLKELMDNLRESMKVTTDAEVEANYERAYANALAEGSVALSQEEVAALGEQSEEMKKYAAAVAAGSNAAEEMGKKEYKKWVQRELGKNIDEEALTAEESLYLAYTKGVEVLGDNSAAQQAAAASTIFGKNAMAGMLNIINASDEDYEKLTENIYNADGAAEEMAETMGDNLEGKITILKSALEGLAISFSEQIIPTVTDVVEKITELVDKFNSLDDGTKKNIVTAAAIAAAIGPVLLILGKLITSISSIIGLCQTVAAALGTGGVAGALSALISPVGLVVAAVAALVAAWVTDFGHIQEHTAEVFGAISETLGGIMGDIVEMFAGDTGDISQTFSDAWAAIEELADAAMQFLQDTIIAFLQDIKQKWDSDWMGIKSVTEQVVGMIKTLFQGFTQALTQLFNAFSALFRGDWSSFWENIKGFFGTVWNTILSLLSGFLKAIISAFLGIAVSIYNAAKDAMNEAKKAFEEIWKNITDWFEKAKEDPVEALKSIGSKLYEAGKEILGKFWEGLQAVWKTITGWFEDIGSWISEKLSSIKNAMSDASDAADSVGSSATKTAKRTGTSVVQVQSYNRGGLDYVPYDGYTAVLHTGERVLTQEEAREYSGRTTQNFIFNGTPPLDEYQTARQFKLAQREIALGM